VPIEPGKFEEALLPHLNAAYNLARWLVRNDYDAEDVVQQAYLRAFRFFRDFRGGDAQAWLLTIVRNTCYTFLRKNCPQDLTTAFSEATDGERHNALDPEALILQTVDSRLLREALEELPLNAREVLVLREFEGLCYREIAEVANIPIGTVMSSIHRARERLRRCIMSRRDPTSLGDSISSEMRAVCEARDRVASMNNPAGGG
jgi:RNA polymerase sigma factor (sigma-70 family)